MTDRSLQRMIHVGCKQLGIDNETRRDLQLVVTGKASMSDMTDPEMQQVLAALKARGFKGKAGTRRPAAKRRGARYCHVLWRLLHQAGEAKVAGRDGLNAFIRARFESAWGHVPLDIDMMTEARQINDVIEALKDWCRRAGIPTTAGSQDG